MKHSHVNQTSAENAMNKQHTELFATLHQLAATVTTVFEVLADPQQGDGPGDIPASPSPGPAPETRAAEPPRKDACLGCGRACEAMTARVQRGRICSACVVASAEDLQRQYERARLEEVAGCIRDQLALLDRLVGEAIYLDGAHSLPALELEIVRLCDLFRARRGPFTGGSASAVFDDADLDVNAASRMEAQPS